MIGKLFVTVEEAAELLSCSKATVYRLIHEGVIPAVRMPSAKGAGSYRIRVADLERSLPPVEPRGQEEDD